MLTPPGDYIEKADVFITDDFMYGVPLLPDSLPELNFESVESHLSNLTGPKIAGRGPPERTPFPGKYDFVVEFNSSTTHRKKYVISHKLNRIYVDMEHDFPVHFNWRGPPAMFVRAACVFADDAQAQKRVERCLQHFHQCTNNNDIDPAVARNVLHSSRGSTGDVTYCGDAGAPDSWLSVLVALSKPDATFASHAYRFTCKNSCTSGINRRAILIIFTLEDRNGVVHGRQLVGARVCACPNRDIRKDEESETAPRGNKRRAVPAPSPPPAKVKREELDDTVLDLATLNPQAAILGLEVMIKMEEQANETRNDSRACDVIARLKQIQQDLKKKQPAQ